MAPVLRLREPREQTAEPIIVEIPGANRLSGQMRQQFGVTFDPVLDLILGVVAPGQDEGDPNRQHPPAAQVRVQTVISDLSVVDSRNAQFDQQTEQQRQITYSCLGKLECLIHAPNDTQTISKSPGFISGKRQL